MFTPSAYRRRWLLWSAALIAAVSASAARAAPAPDFVALAAKVAPAVVNINIDRTTDSSFIGDKSSDDSDAAALGSGVIISTDGYILTSAHVVAGATAINVKLADGRVYPARLIGSDRESDLALLRITASDLAVAHFGDADALRPGQWVVAIGSPFGLENTVTAGVISAVHRHLQGEPYVSYIQTDAPINPGSSGGPLLNLKGEVVGINSEIYTGSGEYMGVSFAVPSNLAMIVVRQLRAAGAVSHGWLGVNVSDVPPQLARTGGIVRPAGALVTEIAADSPAARAQLQAGDIIVGFDGKPVGDPADLPPLVGAVAAGAQASLTILRDGTRERVDVTLGRLERDADGAFSGDAAPLDRLGLAVRDLTAKQKRRLGIDGGVLVEYVADGAARRAGIYPGDVILRFGRGSARSADQLKTLESRLKTHELVPVLVLHKQTTNFVTVKMPPP